MKRKTLRGYYKYVKSLPCLACGQLPRPGNPNHADHIRPYSYKFNHFTVRSHNGLPAFYCVPICPECHRTRHTMREQDFYEQAGYPLAVLYTSKTCHRCGALNERRKHAYVCTRCGYQAHADANAAMNVRDWHGLCCPLELEVPAGGLHEPALNPVRETVAKATA